MDTQALAEMQSQGKAIVNSIENELTTIKLFLDHAIDVLYSYVYDRELPYAVDGCGEADTLSDMIRVLGTSIDFVKGHDYSGLSPQFLQNGSGLADMLVKAESYLMIDFPDYCCWDFYSEDKTPLRIFSLETVAELAGRSTGSIRNSTLESGDLKVVKLNNVCDYKGDPVGHSVFVEYEEACRWLEKKRCYEPLKTEQLSTSELMSYIKTTGPVFNGACLPAPLLLREKGPLQVFYAPFEYVNTQAKVVLCGITPGAAQAEVALNTLASALQKGLSETEALQKAKTTASFAGPMRRSLTKMLDHIGLHQVLGLNSCAQLFDERADLVHYTSALRNPVFYKGGNYTGVPLMLKESALKWQVDEHLADEVQRLGKNTIYIPLGPKPAEALLYLAEQGLLDEAQILSGLPHPSGANAERIKYFCEEKDRSALSSRTNADALDEARMVLKTQVQRLV